MSTWYEGLSPKDWLFDGHPIQGQSCFDMWDMLDWSNAYCDLGPSPAGNPGPYWHVLLKGADTVHRLYPKVLQTRWLPIIHQAIEEIAAKASTAPLKTAEGGKTT